MPENNGFNGSNLNRGTVRILAHTAGGACLPAAAARLSTQPGGAAALYDEALGKPAEHNARLLRRVLSSGHHSLLEHAVFHIAFDGASAAAEQFFIEHRLASYTVKSRRYVDFSGAGAVVPDFEGAKEPGRVRAAYDALCRSLFDTYDALVKAGVPLEDARFVLPYGFKGHFFLTVNARELRLMLARMVAANRSAELRALGESLWAQAEAACPALLDGLVAVSVDAPDALDDAGKRADDRFREAAPSAALTLHTPDPDRAVAAAQLGGMLPPGEIPDDLVGHAVLAALADLRPRALEHASFTFSLRDVSLAAATHFTRHRMLSLIVPPLTAAPNHACGVVPASVRDEVLLSLYKKAFELAADTDNVLRAAGVKPCERVYARLAGSVTRLHLTMNAREARLFFGLRTCARAQWEIRALAQSMLLQAKEAAPLTFSNCGPGCVQRGACPEGAMSCGQAALMREAWLGSGNHS